MSLKTEDVMRAIHTATVLSFVYHEKLRFAVPFNVTLDVHGDVTHIRAVEKNNDSGDAIKTYLVEKMHNLVITNVSSPHQSQLLDYFERITPTDDMTQILTEEQALNNMMLMRKEDTCETLLGGTAILKREHTYIICDIRAIYKDKK